jgi:hypothetical protein
VFSRGFFILSAFVALAVATAGVIVFVAREKDSNGARDGARPQGRSAARTQVDAGGGGAESFAATAGLFDRLTRVRAPMSDLVIRLFSPHPVVEECVDQCPPQLRMVGGAEGYQLAWEAAEGIADDVEILANDPGLDPELGATIAATVRALRRSAEGTTNRGLRALLVRGVEGIPAGASHGIGLSLSDMHDRYFDHHRPPRGGGVRILVNRIEGAARSAAERDEAVAGVIELAGDGVGGGSRVVDLEQVRFLRHPLGLHFTGERAPVVGLALDRAGDVFVYGYRGEGLRRLPRDDAVRGAIEAVLRRL